MIKVRLEEDKIEDGILLLKRYIIEMPVSLEVLQDCYLYAPMDAPSELKDMLLTAFGEEIDKLILTNNPNKNMERWLKNKLETVKIETK